MAPSILAVIVLYKTAARDSITVTSLVRALRCTDNRGLRFRALLFDNSPKPDQMPGIFSDEVYLGEDRNGGLALAYNTGLRMAQQDRFDWLLTLDQDTDLPESFLADLLDAIAKVDADSQIAAIVGQIRGNGRMLSPYRFRWGGVPVWFPVGFIGIVRQATFALNSSALLRVSALTQIGGYDPRFWLDASDHAVFATLAEHGKRVFVDGNIQVSHQLSVLQGDHAMSPDRNENMLAAESAFWDLFMGPVANWVRNGRLIGRLIRQRNGEAGLRRPLLEHLRFRMVHGRRQRLRMWEQQVLDRIAPSPVGLEAGPTVSVCLAAYNGERYIEEQILSILPQIGERDELVVVDDASTDSTRERILAIEDRRIMLICHTENQGVVATFEDAVRSATGKILFLCDGDDVWAPDKVKKVLRAFSENPRAQVVQTGLRLINENGQAQDAGSYVEKQDFTASVVPNLLRNRFQGSAMAFRASLLAQVLPFPKGRLFLHDAWIGIRNSINGGQTVYLAEPLLYYRRHGQNLSQPMGLKGQLVKRLELVASLVAWGLRSFCR